MPNATLVPVDHEPDFGAGYSLVPVDHNPFSQQQEPVPQAYPLMPQQTHLPQAEAAMNLTPQEQALYMRHITNLHGPGGVDNAPTPEDPAGSRSTLYASVEPHGGQFSVIPTVWDGQIQTQRWQRPADGKQFDIPNSTALSNVQQAGWQNFPSYSTPQEAEGRYTRMHDFLEQDTRDYNRDKPPVPQGGYTAGLGLR